MPHSSETIADLDTTREDLRVAKMEMQSVWNALKAARDDIFDLQLRLLELSTAGSGNKAAVQNLRQYLKAKEIEADSAYNAQCEAKERISRFQSVLDAAKHDNRPICGVIYPHMCMFTRPTFHGNTFNIRHRFHKPQFTGKSRGSFGYKVSNQRIVAFRDIQKTTQSKLHNGHSCLRIDQDADGNVTRHMAEKMKDDDDTFTDSWSLLRERFRLRAQKHAKQRDEQIAQSVAYAEWCRRMHPVHYELRRMIHPSDVQDTVRLYVAKVLIRNWEAALHFRIVEGKLR